MEQQKDKSKTQVTALRVLLTQEVDGSFFAQGLEIDYAAEGATLEEAKNNFASGLRETIREHLLIYGHLTNLIQPAPQRIWIELLRSLKRAKPLSRVNLESKHPQDELPFEQISFFAKPSYDGHA